MLTKPTCDVCVVGAGPAGIAAAVQLHSAGANVLVVQMRPPASRMRHPGWETLSAQVVPLLKQLRCLSVAREVWVDTVTAHVSSWGSEEIGWADAIKRPGGGNKIVNREVFDSTLREAAIAQGVVLIEADAVNVEDLGVRYRVSLENACLRNLSAPFVVDASGRNARIAHALGAKRIFVDRLVAQWLMVQANDNGDCTVRIDAVEDGWVFTMKAGGQRLLCFFSDGDLCKFRSMSGIKQSIQSRAATAPTMRGLLEWSTGLRTSACGVTIAASSVLDRAAGRRWVTCGDAAQTFDPLSSQGTYQAIVGGCRVAAALVEYHNGDSQALEKYDRIRRSEFVNYVAALRRQYLIERRWSTSPFWSRRHNLLDSENVQLRQLLRSGPTTASAFARLSRHPHAHESPSACLQPGPLTPAGAGG